MYIIIIVVCYDIQIILCLWKNGSYTLQEEDDHHAENTRYDVTVSITTSSRG